MHVKFRIIIKTKESHLTTKFLAIYWNENLNSMTPPHSGLTSCIILTHFHKILWHFPAKFHQIVASVGLFLLKYFEHNRYTNQQSHAIIKQSIFNFILVIRMHNMLRLSIHCNFILYKCVIFSFFFVSRTA